MGSCRFELVQRLTERRPLLVIKRGRILRRNLRKEFLTPYDVRERLREKGIEDVSTLRLTYMEGDGSFSVITNDRSRQQEAPARAPGFSHEKPIAHHRSAVGSRDVPLVIAFVNAGRLGLCSDTRSA